MEEAEAICSQLGIMVNGELKCLGNLQHIKSKHGEGYSLLVKFNMNKTETDKVEEFIDFILTTFLINNGETKEIHDGFINIHFNDNSVKLLANLFKVIEKIKTQYEIEYYAVTQTKLEQIFLNFASKQIDPLTRHLSDSFCCYFNCC